MSLRANAKPCPVLDTGAGIQNVILNEVKNLGVVWIPDQSLPRTRYGGGNNKKDRRD